MPLREIPFRFFETLCILLLGTVIEDSSRWNVSETELENVFPTRKFLPA